MIGKASLNGRRAALVDLPIDGSVGQTHVGATEMIKAKQPSQPMIERSGTPW